MKQIEKKVLKICKQLYEIGVNDGKNKPVYFPLPPQFYADKISKALQQQEDRVRKEVMAEFRIFIEDKPRIWKNKRKSLNNKG